MHKSEAINSVCEKAGKGHPLRIGQAYAPSLLETFVQSAWLSELWS